MNRLITSHRTQKYVSAVTTNACKGYHYYTTTRLSSIQPVVFEAIASFRHRSE